MSESVSVRVRVLEAWDDILLRPPPTTRIGDVKQLALEATGNRDDASRFQVKFRGAAVRDESRTLADEHVPDDAAMIVMRRRRVPVR